MDKHRFEQHRRASHRRGSLTVCSAVAVVFWWPGLPWPSQSKPQSQAVAEQPAATEQEVLAHPFWRAKVTRAQLDAVLARALAPGAPGLLFVYDDGVASHLPCFEGESAEVARHVSLVTDGLGGSRPLALGRLKAEMDALVAREGWERRFGQK